MSSNKEDLYYEKALWYCKEIENGKSSFYKYMKLRKNLKRLSLDENKKWTFKELINLGSGPNSEYEHISAKTFSRK